MAWPGHLQRFCPWLLHCGSARRAVESSYRHCPEVAETKESAPGSSRRSAWRWILHRLSWSGLSWCSPRRVRLPGRAAACPPASVAYCRREQWSRCWQALFPPLSDVQGSPLRSSSASACSSGRREPTSGKQRQRLRQSRSQLGLSSRLWPCENCVLQLLAGADYGFHAQHHPLQQCLGLDLGLDRRCAMLTPSFLPALTRCCLCAV